MIVKIQVQLTGDQAVKFEKLRAVLGSTKSKLAGLLIVVGMRYLIQIVNPNNDDEKIGRKIKAKLIDGSVIEGIYKATTENAASSYGQKVIEIDGKAIDEWQIVEVENLE